MLRSITLTVAAMTVLSWSLAASAGAQSVRGRPLGTEEWAGLAEDSLSLYQEADFGGDPHEIHPVTQEPPGQPQELESGTGGVRVTDEMSSLRWNLPPGVVVVFYSAPTATGRQITVWGEGQLRSLTASKFDDKASRWAWYFVGGVDPPGPQVSVTPPPGATGLSAAMGDSVQLREGKNHRGAIGVVTRVSNFPEGTLLKIPDALDDSTSSLRWKLPEGLIVVFYEHASGKGRQISIWHEAEIRDLAAWGLSDKASAWAWYFIGGDARTAVSSKVCPACGGEHPTGAKGTFCPHCGAPWEDVQGPVQHAGNSGPR